MAGYDGAVLFACGDPELRALEPHRATLSPRLRFPLGGAEWSDKRLLYRALAGQVSLPRTWVPDTDADVRAALREARYPLLIKPAEGHGWRERLGAKKLLVAHSASEAATATAAFPPEAFVLQEEVAGPESRLEVFATHIGRDGSHGPWVTARKLRQYPAHYGSACALVTTRAPDVVHASLEVLRRLDYRGTAGVEWKRDSNGRLWFIELNPRPVLWIGVAEPVVWDAYCDVAERARPAAEPVAPGRTWSYLVRDLVRAGPAALRPVDVRCEWAWDDPLPGAWSLLHAARQQARAIQGERGARSRT